MARNLKGMDSATVQFPDVYEKQACANIFFGIWAAFNTGCKHADIHFNPIDEIQY